MVQFSFPTMIDIHVQRLDGQSLQFESIDPQTTVFELKGLCAERCNVPVVCQALVRDTTLLANTERLADICIQGSLSLNLVAELKWTWSVRITLKRNTGALALELQSCSGAAIQLEDMDAGAQVGNLKYVCAPHCHLPPACQELVNRHTVLQDSEPVTDMFGQEDELVLLMFPKLESLHQRLSSGSRSKHHEALDEIERFAPEVDQIIIDDMLAHLENTDRQTRVLASKALATITPKGDEYVTSKSFTMLKSPGVHARRSALRTLSMVTKKGDAAVIEAVSACREDSEREIRAAVATTLSVIANRDDARTLQALGALLEDRDWQVVEEARRAFGEVGNAAMLAAYRDTMPKTTMFVDQ